MQNNQKIMDAALIEYLDECAEMQERLAKNLTRIEQGETTQDILDAIYRDMHTIKGSSQLYGFNQVGELAHAMETCLDPVRKGQAAATARLVDILYVGSDIITRLLAGIRATKTEPDLKAEVQALVLRLIDIAEQMIAKSAAFAPDKMPADQGVEGPGDSALGSAPAPTPRPPATPVLKPAPVAASPQSTASENLGFGIFDDEPAAASAPPAVSKPPLQAPVKLPEKQPAVVAPAKAATPPPAAASAPSTPAEAAKPAGDEGANETIRVHVSLLDSLMNLVGEQVLIRNQLLQHAKINDTDAELNRLSQRLNVLTAELQNEVMKTRMQPVGNVLNKFSRVVRDMGRDLGKKIDLTIFGADTELDKTIIEAIKDPLTHIVRNSVDHGIELPADRKLASKPEAGHLTIKAHHESGQVIIEIADDGRGLDPQRIGPKAIEKGIVSTEALARMSEREVQSLIFAPGFSTAATVSNISGRGVGMDVVKTNIERIGGLVDLQSVPGRGTTITFKIPLTLAIVPALIVRALGQRFAIPQSKLIELVLIDETNPASEQIEMLQDSPVLRLRGKILPLLKLSEILSQNWPSLGKNKARPERAGASAQPEPSTTNVVVLNADGFQFGLIVESVDDTADIVVKSLASFLKDIAHFSGATIMGDGSVALTIDVMGISNAAKLRGDADLSATTPADTLARKKSDYQTDVAEFLLVDVGAPASYAIPLAVVARLEEFTANDFDFSGEQKVVRYRDSLLPISSLPNFLHLPFPEHRNAQDKTPVVVIRRGDQLHGIEVFEIRDVVSMPAKIDQTIRDRPGILGTMITGEDVLVVVDILGMIDAVKAKLSVDAGVLPSAGAQTPSHKQAAARRQKRILVAEDSSFFRNYVRQVLEDAGFQIETAPDGAEAWVRLDAAKEGHFALVLSDIEMPAMDGFELASKISGDARFRGLPLVAITTRFSNADIERGRQVGFTRYLEKLNAEKLIGELDLLLLQKSPAETGTATKEMKRASSY